MSIQVAAVAHSLTLSFIAFVSLVGFVVSSWVPWIGFVCGLMLVVITAKSVINTIILPRMTSSKITYGTYQFTFGAFHMMAKRLHRYEQKDRLLAYLVPVMIIVTLLIWLLLFLTGYALMFWPLVGDLGVAVRLSGSSIFTLGVMASGLPGPTGLEFLAAATGLIVVALQIGYLPTLYGAYNRREILVTSLHSRAGAPAWGPEILARHRLSEATDSLPAMYAAWETLAADIAESHTSYPWLMGMRSPSHLNSWVISLLAVLDSAALYISLCPMTVPTEARQCLRMGFVAMRALARAMGISVDHDPLPTDPLELTFEQFARGVEHMRRAGFPLERTAEDAWRDFHGWRVNYESAAYRLADRLSVVPAPWSGKRRHMSKQDFVDMLPLRPRHRTPDDPEGKRVLERQMSLPADRG